MTRFKIKFIGELTAGMIVVDKAGRRGTVDIANSRTAHVYYTGTVYSQAFRRRSNGQWSVIETVNGRRGYNFIIRVENE